MRPRRFKLRNKSYPRVLEMKKKTTQFPLLPTEVFISLRISREYFFHQLKPYEYFRYRRRFCLILTECHSAHEALISIVSTPQLQLAANELAAK